MENLPTKADINDHSTNQKVKLWSRIHSFKYNLKMNIDVEVEFARKIKQENFKMTVLLELKSTRMVNKIFKNTKLLAGIILQLKKSIIEISREKRVGVRGDKLIIDDMSFYWYSQANFCV